MASTYTPQRAVEIVTKFVHGIPLDAVQSDVCDLINSLIWTAFYWRWSVKAITPFTLVDSQQDYPNVLPTDFGRIKALRIARTDISPIEYRELNIRNFLAVDVTPRGTLNSIRAASIEPSLTAGIRLEMAPSIASPTVLKIYGEYQFASTRITQANMNTPLVQPDDYFDTFLEGVKWKIYQFSDDPRAGTLQVTRNGERTATGQLGIWLNSLNDMQRAEDFGDGQESLHPEDPLGFTRAGNPGLFGM